MGSTLHPKIQERKAKFPFIMRSAATGGSQVEKPEDFLTLLEKRVVRGYSSLWTSRNDYGEMFIKGSYAKTITERGPKSGVAQPIKFLRQHNQGDPLSLFEILEEDEIGLKFETKPLDPVDSADRVLVQLRSGTLNNYSNGFLPVWSKAEYDEKTDTIIYREVNLYEISVVGLASDSNTYTIRSLEDFTEEELNLSDDIEGFIRTLPRKDQLEARFLFARQKSLFEAKPVEPLETRKADRDGKKKINMNYLIKNL